MSGFQNITIEPVFGTWGNQALDKVTLVDDVALSLENSYFEFQSIDLLGVTTDRYIWFDGGTGVDPALAGKTGTAVVYTSGDSAATIAALAVTAINGLADVNCVADSANSDTDSILIQRQGVGIATAAADGAAPTGFTFSAERVGSRLDLGLFDGDAELAFAEDMLDVTAQQHGTTILERLRTGMNIDSVTLSMKEVTALKLKAILEAGGASVTPAGGTEFSGWGNSKLFTAISGDSRKLQLHPARITDQTDLSQDWGFWLAYPSLESLNFSGESEQKIGVSFSFLPDCLMNSDIDRGGYRDHSQNLLRV